MSETIHTHEALSESLLSLHKRTYNSVSDQVWGANPVCESCGHQYPCDTVKLIKQHKENS